jgi:ubiquinol-cytochrome c reductase cytochrome c subunit
MKIARATTSLAILAGLLPAWSSVAIAASADQGKTAFMRAGCWQCHGTVGQGGVAGPRLAPDPIPSEAFSAFVRSSSRQMPPYHEDVLSNADLADIHAYLQSVPKPPDYKTLPLLSR